MKKLLALVLSLIMVIGLFAGCSDKNDDKGDAGNEGTNTGDTGNTGGETADYSNVKIGVLLSGSSKDGGWSQMAADAATDAAKAYPGATVNFTESLVATDFESAMRAYAGAGYTIIVAHGAEFLDASKLVAAEYPNITFINTSAQEAGMAGAPGNLTGIDFATTQLGFLNGAACAMATESKKIGAIGSMEIDSIIAWVEGVKAGAKYIDPECEVISIFTGSFDDALKAKQAVDALIPKGVDVITQNADACGLGAVQQCDALGLINVGAVSDQTKEGDSVMVSIMQDAQLGITKAIEKAVDKKLPAGFVSMGATDGVISITDYAGKNKDALTADEKAALQDLWQKSYDGTDLMTLTK